MWPDDLGPGSCIVLSGNDDLCNAEGARKMLVAEGQAKVGSCLAQMQQIIISQSPILSSHHQPALLMRYH